MGVTETARSDVVATSRKFGEKGGPPFNFVPGRSDYCSQALDLATASFHRLRR